MIRTVTGWLDPATDATIAEMELLGATELLVTSPDSHATTFLGPALPGDDYTQVALGEIAAIRASPETFVWNVQLPSIEEVERELIEGAAPSPYMTSYGQEDGPPPMLVLHAPGVMPLDRTPLRALAEKLERRVVVVTGCLPVLPSSFTHEAEAVDKAAKMLAHRLRFGVPVLGTASTTSAAAAAAAEEEGEAEESLQALHDQAQRVGVGFIGLLELLGSNDEQRQAPLLAAAAKASLETGAPIFLTTQDAFGRVLPDVARLGQAIDTLSGLGVPAHAIVLCRLPGAAALEPTYREWLQRGVTLALTFQGGVFYSLVVEDKAKGITRDYTSDGEGAALVASLCRQGFAANLILSPGVSCRLQLRRYGGHGYGHVRHSIVHQLVRRGVGDAELDAMAHDNIVRLLGWWTPPPPVERAVEMGTCYWCKKAFEMRENEYFHKFDFVYCRSKCLSKHGDAGWQPVVLK